MLYTYSKQDKDLKVLLAEAMTFAEPVRQALTQLGDPIENPNPLAVAVASLLVFTMTYERESGKGYKNANIIVSPNDEHAEFYFDQYGLVVEKETNDAYVMTLYDHTNRKKPTQWAREHGWSFSKS